MEDKNWWNRIWYFVGSVFALLLGLFFYERSKRKDAESDLAHAESDKKDAVLADRQEQDKLLLEAERKKLEAEKGRTLTAEELADWFGKNK
jgi:hypothetical protein